MKTKSSGRIAVYSLCVFIIMSCGSTDNQNGTNTEDSPSPISKGQSSVSDDVSSKDVVKIAIGSKDHSTLVTALQAGELVDALSNAGPFTVFAPVNSAFDALPSGTVENLLKPENKESLQNILQYHVAVAIYNQNLFQNGQKISMVNGGSVEMTKKGEKWFINDAEILTSVKASNGLVYIIDKVLLPK